MYGAKLVEARQKPKIVHTVACHIFSPAYLQSRNTATASSSARDAVAVTVRAITPFPGSCGCSCGGFFRSAIPYAGSTGRERRISRTGDRCSDGQLR